MRHHGFNLHQGVQGQAGNRQHRHCRRSAREEGCTDFRCLLRICQAGGKKRDPDHIVHFMANAFQNGLDVVHALARLLCGTPGHQGAGFRVQRQLGGQVVVVGKGHGLRRQRALGCGVRVSGHLHQVAGLRCARNAAFPVRYQCFDLHQRVQGQCGHRHRRPRRHIAAAKEGGHHRVHGVQVGDVAHKHAGAHHIVHRVADAVQDRLGVFKALPRLFLHPAGHHGARLWVHRQLGGQVVVVRKRHALRMQTCGLRGLWRVFCRYFVVTTHERLASCCCMEKTWLDA